MKAIALIIVLFSSVSSFAQQVDHSALISKVFQTLELKLKVEWDQKDQKFYQASVEDFQKDLASLKDVGVEYTEVVEYLKNNILSEKDRIDFERYFSTLDFKNTPASELAFDLVSKMDQTLAKGASYYPYWYSRPYVFVPFISLCLGGVVISWGYWWTPSSYPYYRY
jgi:hypothetical protein